MEFYKFLSYSSYQIMKIPIAYIINLDEQISQWNILKNNLEEQNIVAKRIPAIHKDKLNDKFIGENVTFLCQNTCTDKAIAISASHIKAWKQIISDNNPYSMVLEDDVIINKDLHDSLKKLPDLPNDFDIFFCGCFGCNPKGTSLPFMVLFPWFTKNSRNMNRPYYVPQLALGSHCYILSQKGARKLVKLVEKNITTHIDFHLQQLANAEKIKVYTIYPSLVNQSSSLIYTGFPILLNQLVDKIEIDKHYFLPFYLSTPICQLLSYPICGWTLLFVIFTYLCKIYQVDKNTIFFYFFLILFLDIFSDPLLVFQTFLLIWIILS